MRGSIRNAIWVMVCVTVIGAGAVVAACGSDYSVPDAGGEGGACYPNGTCNQGLTCASNLCVQLADGGPAIDAGVDPRLEASVTETGPVQTDSGGYHDAGLMCPGPYDKNQAPTWRTGVQTLNACSTADLSTVNALKPDADTYDIYGKISDSCRACMFSNEMDGKWQVIVGLPNMAADYGFANQAECVKLVGATDTCAAAFGALEICATLACAKACPSSCSTDPNVMLDICGDQVNDIINACGGIGNAQTYQMKCASISQVTNVICGTGN